MADNIPTTDDGFKLHVVDALATLRKGQEIMSTRLFGGDGQKGTLEYLAEYTKKVEADAKTSYEDLTKKQEKLDKKIIWFSGASSGFGAALGIFLGKLGIHI